MMRRALYALSARLPVRIIAEENRPYLERYYYVGTALGMRFYLHRFVGSDPDRGLHDYPWRWAVSLIFTGPYIEERRNGTFIRRRLNFLVGDNFHRVVLPEGARDVWTLFIHRAGQRKPWGFLRPFPNEHTMLWSAFQYTGGEQSEEKRWWLTYPKGRDEARRMPA